MYISVKMNGVTQTPTGHFKVVSACKPLTYSAINGVGTPYSYLVPDSNQATIETVFALLTTTTSQLTTCPLVIAMKNAAGNTITPAAITLESTYPYTLKVDRNQVVD